MRSRSPRSQGRARRRRSLRDGRRLPKGAAHARERAGEPLSLPAIDRLKPANLRAYMADRRMDGIGSRTLTMERERKSESRETTFPYDVTDREVLADQGHLRAVDEDVGARGGAETPGGRTCRSGAQWAGR